MLQTVYFSMHMLVSAYNYMYKQGTACIWGIIMGLMKSQCSSLHGLYLCSKRRLKWIITCQGFQKRRNEAADNLVDGVLD